MPKLQSSGKGVVLLIVIGVIFISVLFAGIALKLITSQSSLTQHQVYRIKAYYAAKGIMNYAQDMLRKGTWTPHDSNKRYVCHSKVAGGNCSSLSVSPPYYATISTDSNIPYDILVTIYPLNQALVGTVTQLDIKTKYTSS